MLERTLRALLGCALTPLLFASAAQAVEEPPASEAPPARGLARVAQTSELRVGMSGEQPPLSMTARNGELVGLDVALAKVLAQTMGVEIHFVRLPFGQLLDALEAGDVDLVISGLTITPARAQRAILVGPYYTSGKCILTKSAELAAIEDAGALDAPRYRLAAMAGSTSETFARKSAPKAKLTLTGQLDEGIQKVLQDQVDALVGDRETCSFAVLRYPGAGLLASEKTFTIEPMGVAVADDQTRFARMIETYLSALKEQGVIEKARAFWLEDPSWVAGIR
jgi:ABC-type amino acid transport substrate-binding protein